MPAVNALARLILTVDLPAVTKHIHPCFSFVDPMGCLILVVVLASHVCLTVANITRP